MQHAVFAALFVVQYELHGNARLAGPVRLRRVAAVSDQVSRIIRTSHGNSGISNDCVSIVDCSRQYGINKARQQAETSGQRHEGLAEKENKSRNRSEEHTSELQSLMSISYAVFCLKKKK